MSILIAGAGALGSHLVLLLRNLDFVFDVVDFDRVEMKNTRSQFHSTKSVGKLKPDSLKSVLDLVFGKKNVRPFSVKMVKDNAQTLVSGGDNPRDLVVDCFDNIEARRLLQETANANRFSVLHGGLAADGAFGRVGWDTKFSLDSEDVAGQATCEAGDFLPFIGLVSSCMAMAVQRFMKDQKKVSYNIAPTGDVISF